MGESEQSGAIWPAVDAGAYLAPSGGVSLVALATGSTAAVEDVFELLTCLMVDTDDFFEGLILENRRPDFTAQSHPFLLVF